MKDKNKKEKIEYISLLEAAKKSGYAQDYLSLLCRQGKLKGEKIGRNWVTTYQWLDEYQQNLISDIYPEKTFGAIKKTFKIKERKIKITCPQWLCHRQCRRGELVLTTSLFFLILLGGFAYAKNPQFFSDFAPLEIMSRNLSQLDNNVKKISISKMNLRPKFLTGVAENIYQTENQIIYRLSEMLPQTPSVEDFRYSVSAVLSEGNNIYCRLQYTKGRLQNAKEKATIQIAAFGEKISDNSSENIYSRVDAGKSIAMFPLKVGEKFGEGVIVYPINIPIKIGDSFDKGFKKSDLVLNSLIGKTHIAIQDNFNPIRNIPRNLTGLSKNINDSFSWVSYYFAGISNGVNNFSNEIATLLPSRLPAPEVAGFGGQAARNDDISKSEGDNIYCRLQDSFENFGKNLSKGASVFFETTDIETDREKEFGRVAGVSDSIEENTEVKLLQNLPKFNFRNSISEVGKFIWETPIRVADESANIVIDGPIKIGEIVISAADKTINQISEAYIFTGKSLANGVNNFSDKVIGYSNKIVGFFSDGLNNFLEKLAGLFDNTYFGLTQLFVEQGGEKISQVQIQVQEGDDPDRRLQESLTKDEGDNIYYRLQEDTGERDEIKNLKEGLDILKQEIDELKKVSTGKIIQQNITQEIIREIIKEQKGEQGPAGATGPQGPVGAGTTIVQGGDAYLSGENTWIGGNVFEGHSSMNSLGVSHNTSVGNNLSVGGAITTGTAINTQYGGTGQNWSAVAQGNVPYFSGVGTLSTLTPGTSGYFLKTQGPGLNPVWAAESTGVGPHNLLSVTHSDTTAGAVARGDLITGQTATPAWTKLALGTSSYILRSDGTDVSWSPTTNITELGNISAGAWQGTLIGSQYGGTGADLSAAVQGSVPYFSAVVGTMADLSPGTAGQALISGGAGADPSWGQAGVNDATYLTLSLNDSLSAERVLTAGTNISFTDAGVNSPLTVATVDNPVFSTSVTSPLLTNDSGDLIVSTTTFGDLNLTSVDDLTLTAGTGILTLGAGTNTIVNTDADTAILINPNGTGAVQFHSASNYLDASGNLILDGDITLTSGGTFYTTANGDLVFAPNGSGNLVIGETANPAKIIPFADSTVGYDLGEATQRWYDLYLKNSIDIDSTKLDIDSLNFVGLGQITTGASTDLTLQPGTGGKTVITDGTDYVQIADGTRALYAVKGSQAVELADGTWAIDATGDVRLSQDITITGGKIILGSGTESIDNETSNLLKLITSGDTKVVLGDNAGANQFQIADSDNNVVAYVDSDGNVSAAAGAFSTYVQTPQIQTGSGDLTLAPAGKTTTTQNFETTGTGAITSAGLLTAQDGLTVSGTGNILFSTSGTINQSGSGQVTFSGNVDATNGLDITGVTNLGDGGTANYAQFSATGDLTLVGTADTIQKSDGALIIQTTGQNLTVQTTSSGNLALTSADDLTLTAGAGNLTLGAGTNTIVNTDAATDLLINPTGKVQFQTSDYWVDGSGNLQVAKVISPELEYAGDITIDATNDSATSTVSITNSDGSNVANLEIEGDVKIIGGNLGIGMDPNANAIAISGDGTIDLYSAAAPTILTIINSDNTYGISLDIADGGLKTSGQSRLTSAGALENITGYTQGSGSFDMSGSAGTFQTGTGAVSLKGDATLDSGKTLTGATSGQTATSDAVSFGIDETGETGSAYDTLVLSRVNGAANSYALYVSSGDALLAGDTYFGTTSYGVTSAGVGTFAGITGTSLDAGSGTIQTTGTAGFGATTVTSLDVSTGGITQAGAISGATSIDASGTITGGTLTDGAFSVTSGNITGAGNLTFSGSPVVTINNTGTMTWKDNDTPNTLMTLTDVGSTGSLSNIEWKGTAIADTYVANDLTISSSGTVDKGAISGGTLGTAWIDSEVADNLTITSTKIGSFSATDNSNPILTVTQSGTGNLVDLVGDSITAGTGLSMSVNGLSSGSGIAVDSSSTAGDGYKLLNLTSSGAVSDDKTRYGAYSSMTGTGAGTATNYAGYFSATGAVATNVAGYFTATGATNNYGLIVEDGNVGIGTTTPVEKLSVFGGNMEIYDNNDLGSESIDDYSDFTDDAEWDYTGEVAASGVNAVYTYSSTGNGTITQVNAQLANAAVAYRWYKAVYVISSSTVTNATVTITNAFASAATELDVTDGTHTTYFQAKSTAATADFVINITGASSGAFTLESISVKEIQGGDAIVSGLVTGGGTTGIKILADGNVGIGTTDPKQKLHVAGRLATDDKISEGLVGSWHFDEETSGNAHNQTLVDDSGYGNNGTGSGTNGPVWTTGKFGGALDFDGSDDYVDCGTIDALGTKTVSFWMKSNNIATTKVIIYFSDGDLNNDFLVIGTYDSKIIASADGVTDATRMSNVLSSNTWYHIVVKKTTGQITAIYVDGIDRTAAASVAFGGANAYSLIGAGANLLPIPRDPFYGLIDEVRIYKRTLTADEIQQQYNAGVWKYGTGGIAYMDGNVGIGDNTPSSLLTVGTSDAFQVDASGNITTIGDLTMYEAVNNGNPAIRIGAADAEEGHIQAIYDTDAQTLDYLLISTDSTQEGDIVLNANGNVGIGTTTPAYKLDVHSSADTYLSRIYNTSSNAAGAGLYVRIDGDGNLLTLNANGTDIVTISEAQSTFNNPVSMASAGDVSIAYDLLMANTTAGNIKFSGPGYIETDSSWQNLDLTLRAANTGQVIIDDNAYITGTLTVSGGTIDVSGAATDFEIKDNTASAFKISQLTNDYFNITTDDADTTFLIDLPVAGSSTTTANLFSGNVAKTINIGTGTAIDTINIGTDATAADVISIGSSAAGNLTLSSAADIDFKAVSTSVLTVQDADRLKMRDATLLAIGDINEAIIDDMETVDDWSVDPVGQTTVALEETVVKVNDGSMKITTTASSSNTDTLTKTISETAFNVNDRIGFWIRATETGQIISLEFNDDGGTDPHHNITIDAANRWQYEEWDISSYDAEIDAVTGIIFIIDDDTGSPTIYIDQLRYYDKDNRAGEIFVDGDGHLVLAGEQGIELQANITSSLPGLSIDAAIVEINQPLSVNVAGDVGINYDLCFAGTGTSNITSAGPLVIAAGDSNHSENLTITTGGSGDVIVDIVDSTFGFKVLGVQGGYVFRILPSGDLDIHSVASNLNTPFGGFGQYQNLLTYSEELENAIWVDANLAGTPVVLNQIASPDGATTADEIVDDGTGGGTLKQTEADADATETWTFSIWIKDKNTTGNISIEILDDGTTPASSSLTIDPYSEWQRYSITHTGAAGATEMYAIINHDSTESNSFYAWGAQFEETSTAGVYAYTTDTEVATGTGLLAKNLKLSGDLTSDGTLTAGGSGTSTFNDSVSIGSGTAGTIDMTGTDSVFITDDLEIDGDGYLAGDLTVGGETIATPSSDQTRANDSTITIDNTIVRVVGNGAAVILDTDPAIEDGVSDGQIVIIQGTDNTNTVQIVDAVNTALAADGAVTLGQGDTIMLIWDSGDSLWYEVSRSGN